MYEFIACRLANHGLEPRRNRARGVFLKSSAARLRPDVGRKPQKNWERRIDMPEFGTPFSGLARDRKLTNEELARAIRFMVAAEYEAI